MRHLQAARGTAITSSSGSATSSVDAAAVALSRWSLVGGLTLDIVTKIIAVNQLEPLAPVRLLGGLLTLRLIRNPGAAFSQGERFTYVFAIAAIVVLRS